MPQSSKFLCECKAVTANEIKKVIKTKGAESILDIQNLTKASTGCGKCKDAVAETLRIELQRIEAKAKQLRFDF